MSQNDWLHDAARRAAAYLEQLNERRVAPTPADLQRLQTLAAAALPDHGEDATHLLARLDEIGSPATVATAGPRYFGFVNGGALPAALAAHWLATAWDQNAAMRVMSPVAVELERAAHRWILALLGLPESCGAGTTTGAQMATVAGLAAARHAQLARVGWDADRDGLFGAPPVTVVVSSESHSTIFKALAILGFGRDRVVTVPADGQGRMTRLPKLDGGPAIVCLQAGNVNTGAFDDFAAIVPAAKEAGAWVHVDGAFGLWAACSPELWHLTRGYEYADSWATDGHKTLNLPYDCGFIFIRDVAAQLAALRLGGAYLASDQAAEPLWLSPDSSRRARGVDAWMALRSLGRAGVVALVERLCRLARRFADRLRSEVAVLNDVVFNQVLVSFGSPERTRAAIAAIQDDGTCWCGGTQWRGEAAMRISVSNWSTTEADIDRSAAAILAIAARL